jgi:hypothetical protein
MRRQNYFDESELRWMNNLEEQEEHNRQKKIKDKTADELSDELLNKWVEE